MQVGKNFGVGQRSFMRRKLYAALVVLLLAGCAAPTVPDQYEKDITNAAATGKFYIVGKDIIDPNGNIFYPIGANVAIKFTPYNYVFEGNNGGVNGRLNDVKAWKWNTVRATLICDNDLGEPSFDALVNGIDPTIKEFTNAKIVVMLECADSTGKDPKVGDAKDLNIRRFWDEMVRRYKNNPYVWFNIYNEPYEGADTENWRILHEFYVNRIRAQGAENIIVADIPGYAQGINLLATQSFADNLAKSCNVLFGWHAYGAINGAGGDFAAHEQAIQQVQAKNYPLIVGELGVAFPAEWGNAGPWEWNILGFEAMRVLGPKYGIGLLWWHATGDSGSFSLYALKNDRSGFWTSGNGGNLTPYGQKFWDVSQSAPTNRGAFNGNLASSNCKSVTTTPPTGSISKTLTPTEDRDDWAANGANDTALNVSTWQTAYLKFNLASVSGTVTSAKLKIQRQGIPNAAVKFRIYQVTGDAWSEGNAASLPAKGALIREVTGQANSSLTFDVTAFVKSQQAGDRTVTLAISAVNNGWVPFGSSENTQKPQLVVTMQ
jgi:mannan endo-1,4-beta-mannosidase